MLKAIESYMVGLCRNKDGQGEHSHICWESHLKSTVKYADMLAREMDADLEVVRIAAWLHDVNLIMGGRFETHCIEGADHAEKMLLERGLDRKKIAAIKHCVMTHDSVDGTTPEAKIVASADAMSHFDHFIMMAYQAYHTNGLSQEKSRSWILEKYKKSWKKMLPEAKHILEEKYHAIQLILS